MASPFPLWSLFSLAAVRAHIGGAGYERRAYGGGYGDSQRAGGGYNGDHGSLRVGGSAAATIICWGVLMGGGAMTARASSSGADMALCA